MTAFSSGGGSRPSGIIPLSSGSNAAPPRYASSKYVGLTLNYLDSLLRSTRAPFRDLLLGFTQGDAGAGAVLRRLAWSGCLNNSEQRQLRQAGAL